MWNERYSVDPYIYGTEPNTFLAEHAHVLEGPVLSLAEGEGRNGVFLASLGLSVCGVDGSSVALAKAQKLARSRGVEIRTEVADLKLYRPEPDFFSSVISIFAHLPSDVRALLYPRVEESLKPGGILPLEAYSAAQLRRDSGGPKDPDMLMTTEKIQREFQSLEVVLLQEIEREVNEGAYHNGIASVIQFIGRKK
jgi:cyclopropane fatty-acyl-phospholipid synthase-like methyltransferase